jgi:hypothetical protein
MQAASWRVKPMALDPYVAVIVYAKVQLKMKCPPSFSWKQAFVWDRCDRLLFALMDVRGTALLEGERFHKSRRSFHIPRATGARSLEELYITFVIHFFKDKG